MVSTGFAISTGRCSSRATTSIPCGSMTTRLSPPSARSWPTSGRGRSSGPTRWSADLSRPTRSPSALRPGQSTTSDRRDRSPRSSRRARFPRVTSVAFGFDPDQLAAVAAARHQEYGSARPFPHAVIDGLFPDAVLDDVLAEFPSPQEAAWLRFDTGNERKLASREQTALGEITRQLLAELNGAAFIDF